MPASKTAPAAPPHSPASGVAPARAGAKQRRHHSSVGFEPPPNTTHTRVPQHGSYHTQPHAHSSDQSCPPAAACAGARRAQPMWAGARAGTQAASAPANGARASSSKRVASQEHSLCSLVLLAAHAAAAIAAARRRAHCTAPPCPTQPRLQPRLVTASHHTTHHARAHRRALAGPLQVRQAAAHSSSTRPCMHGRWRGRAADTRTHVPLTHEFERHSLRARTHTAHTTPAAGQQREPAGGLCAAAGIAAAAATHSPSHHRLVSATKKAGHGSTAM